LGVGSEFIVRLPNMRTSSPESPSPSKEAAEPTGPFLRALVVDGNVDAAENMAMLVKASGREVRTAYDGPKPCKRPTITDPM